MIDRGRKVRIKIENQRLRPVKSEVARLQSNNALAQKLLKWQPKVSLEDGLSMTIDFFRKNAGLYDAGEYVV